LVERGVKKVFGVVSGAAIENIALIFHNNERKAPDLSGKVPDFNAAKIRERLPKLMAVVSGKRLEFGVARSPVT
jgi:hypothetical protein